MRFRPSPADFHVEEVARLPLKHGGPYSVYGVHKRGITTLQAQERLAAALGLPGSPVTFPALKDRDARSVQYGTLRCDGPEAVEGKGFRRKRHGECIPEVGGHAVR